MSMSDFDPPKPPQISPVSELMLHRLLEKRDARLQAVVSLLPAGPTEYFIHRTRRDGRIETTGPFLMPEARGQISSFGVLKRANSWHGEICADGAGWSGPLR